MSVGSGIPVALTQGNREELYVKDPPVPQSAILYLLQEATKLALPEARLDSPNSMVMDGIWSGEGSEQHKLCPSPSGSASARYFGHRGDNYTDPRRSFKGSFSLLPTPPGSSPWEVMSLINLQCERLLHPEDGEEDEVYEGTPSATGESKSRHGRGASCFKEGDPSPAVPPDNRAGRFAEALGSSSRENKAEDILVQAQLTSITDRCDSAIHAHGRGDLASGSFQIAGSESGGTHCFRSPSVSKGNEDWHLHGRREIPMLSNPDGKGQGLCGTHCAPQLEPGLNLLGSVIHQEIQQPESSFSANADALVRSPSAFRTPTHRASRVSDRGVNADSNSNAIPFVDPPQDVQPQSGPRSVSNNSNCQPAAQHPEPQERLVTRRSELHESCVENVDEEQLKLKANRPASDARWQARKPRKQSHPTRSADLCDPTFKGVTFRMRTELSDNRDQCRLLITSNYSAELLKSIRRVRGGRSRSLASSLKTSSSEEDSDSSSLPMFLSALLPLSENKKCASCDTRKTPLWRDAEDGTPLCNACGIRYKKYRVRCFQCWHIPRKEGNTDSKCFRCGDALRLVTSQRKLTGW
ncbi:GATA-type zinc finger protein 1 isoform X1 [Anguilla anguilla]|uniref:GATA-type zinc finger protein 1 isoform X1 n=1 Tax=Anguilla anguilla TaxID=7936 RepID=UPI0015AFB236|nr:GATA-type zinc finger protein 1 isoform X1 [Anguilla anguilla]